MIHAYTPTDLLLTALKENQDGNLVAIDADTFHQARELCVSLGGNWHRMLLSLTEHIALSRLLYRPYWWFQANTPETWKQEARLFACDCAVRVLPIFETKHPSDPRPRRALAVARRFALGEAPVEEFSAARNAARSATIGAGAIAGAAARSVYWALHSNAGAASGAASWFAVRSTSWAMASDSGEDDAEISAKEHEQRAHWTLLVDRLCPVT